MNTETQQRPQGLLPDFVPLTHLWQGEDPFYPSEGSARWALRHMKDDLVEERAIALHRGRLMIHLKRFREVAERRAIGAANARATYSVIDE